MFGLSRGTFARMSMATMMMPVVAVCVELVYKCCRQTIRAQCRDPARGQVARHVAAGKKALQQYRRQHHRQAGAGGRTNRFTVVIERGQGRVLH